MNLLDKKVLAQTDMQFSWINEPDIWSMDRGILRVTAPEGSDFFIDEEGPSIRDNAPFYYVEHKGDFRLTTRVTVDMKATYDSACLMVMEDDRHWAKLCYENWQDRPAIVSVVTKGMSDDAPSYEIGKTSPYLRINRSGNTYGFHYSPDGHTWRIIRYFNMKAGDKTKIGLAAQCPMGDSCEISFEFLDLTLGKVESAKVAD